MAVLESGIIFSGVPIVKVNYYDDKATDSMLTAGLLEAIQLFALEIFDDESESFKMKKYCIFLHKLILDNEQTVTIYAICDSMNRPSTIKDVMRNIGRSFKEENQSVDTGNLAQYAHYKEIITKKMGDLIYRPEDRLKKVFF